MNFRFGPFSLDIERQELSNTEGPIEVEPQVFALLAFLAENAERVVSKDEIVDHVWDGRIISDANLNTRINAARKAVGDDGKTQSVIRTYPRRGFRFVAELEATIAVMHPEMAGGKSRVLVMPFHNQSSDPELDNFCEALTEDVISELSKLSQLAVSSRTATYALQGERVDIEALGKQRGIRYVVEGGVRRMSQKLRVSVLLSDTSKEGVLWSDHVVVGDEDPFAALDNTIRQIAVALVPTLMRADRQRALDMADPGAWEYYLKGWEHLHDQGIIGQIDEAERAIEDFKRAVELDPKFADAYAGLAQAYWRIAAFHDLPDREALFNEALASARRAVELNNYEVSTIKTLGLVLVNTGRSDEGINTLKRAIALAPNDTEPQLHLGIGLVYAGHISEAIGILETAWETGHLNAFHGATATWLAMALVFDGRPAEAESFAREGVAHPRTQFWANVSLVLSLIGQGKTGEAVVERKALQKFKPGLTCEIVERLTPISVPKQIKLVLNGLRAAGLPD